MSLFDDESFKLAKAPPAVAAHVAKVAEVYEAGDGTIHFSFEILGGADDGKVIKERFIPPDNGTLLLIQENEE